MKKKKGKDMTFAEKLGSPVPVRLWQSERDRLSEYEKKGLNISDIIRRCVKKALPDVVREIREDLQKLEECGPSSASHQKVVFPTRGGVVPPTPPKDKSGK